VLVGEPLACLYCDSAKIGEKFYFQMWASFFGTKYQDYCITERDVMQCVWEVPTLYSNVVEGNITDSFTQVIETV